jgi:hypothetical protein
MMRRAILFVSAIASTLLSSGAFAAGPFGTIHVGNWHGGAYTNDTTGAFSHCAAGANYLNGLYLVISQNAERTWLIGFANPTSPTSILPDGQSIPIQLTFDGQSQFQVFGTSLQGKLISGILPNPALNALRKSHLMVVSDRNASINFDLAMVGRLLPMITGDIPENINFAIKTGALRDFLDNSVVPYRTSELTNEMKTADIAGAARVLSPTRLPCTSPTHSLITWLLVTM